MEKYIKKQVEVETVRFFENPEILAELSEFMGVGALVMTYSDPKNQKLTINTLEGDQVASIGDYIIKGVHGEFYPCKPDIFAETYEKKRSGLMIEVDYKDKIDHLAEIVTEYLERLCSSGILTDGQALSVPLIIEQLRNLNTYSMGV